MSMNLLLGCSTIVLCMAIQCLVVSALLRGLFAMQSRHLIPTTIAATSALLIGVLLVLFAGTLLQMVLWSGLFLVSGEFEDVNKALYHSVVNFTTLGYGDVVMSAERRLLGALEAANGVLMLGLSTSVLYTVVRAMMVRSWHKLEDEHARSGHTQPSEESSSRGEHQL